MRPGDLVVVSDNSFAQPVPYEIVGIVIATGNRFADVMWTLGPDRTKLTTEPIMNLYVLPRR